MIDPDYVALPYTLALEFAPLNLEPIPESMEGRFFGTYLDLSFRQQVGAMALERNDIALVMAAPPQIAMVKAQRKELKGRLMKKYGRQVFDFCMGLQVDLPAIENGADHKLPWVAGAFRNARAITEQQNEREAVITQNYQNPDIEGANYDRFKDIYNKAADPGLLASLASIDGLTLEVKAKLGEVIASKEPTPLRAKTIMGLTKTLQNLAGAAQMERAMVAIEHNYLDDFR